MMRALTGPEMGLDKGGHVTLPIHRCTLSTSQGRGLILGSVQGSTDEGGEL